MNILIVNNGTIPVSKYGGTQRVIWYLGMELVKLGHKVTYLVEKNSKCNFANIINLNNEKDIFEQIPNYIDIIHFNFVPKNLDKITKPYVITIHGNCNDFRKFDKNTIFVSKNHAERFNSNSFVYNGLDWSDYMKPTFTNKKKYFHFLANASWKVKNLKGAIHITKNLKNKQLKVLGGYRFNFKMGLRFTFSPRIKFYGSVGGQQKYELLNNSQALIFPVLWHEPFGLSIIESMFYGCPVFGTNYGSLPEIVTNEVGFLSNNANLLIEALKNVDNFSHKICNQYVVDEFNSFKMAKNYIEKYEVVLNGGKLNKIEPVLKEKQNLKLLDFIL